MLSHVDSLVKEGRLEEALELIVKIRAQDPNNQYAVAYEERVRALLHEQVATKRSRRDSDPTSLAGSVESLLQQSLSYARRMEFDRAFELLDRAARLDNANPAIRQTHAELEKLRQSLSSLNDSKEDVPDRSPTSPDKKEERQVAQQQKIAQYVERSRTFLKADRIDEAFRELMFVVVIDPNNKDALAVSEDIRRRQEQIQMEKSRRKEDELKQQSGHDEIERQARRKQSNADELADSTKDHGTPASAEASEEERKIRSHISKARSYLRSEQFEGALSEIAFAFLVNPLHEDVKKVEEEILAARAAKLAAPKVPSPTEGPMQHLKRAIRHFDRGAYGECIAEVDRGLLLAPQHADLLQLRELVEDEIRSRQQVPDQDDRRTSRNKIAEALVAKVREFMHAQDFDSALTEIALGLAANPDNPELIALEKEIWSLTESANRHKDTVKDPAIRGERIRLHLRAAELHVENGELESALEEVAKAVAIDPDNKEIRRTELLIRQSELKSQGGSNLRLIPGNKRATG